MKKSPKKYTDEFKRDALLLLKTSGKTKSEVERDLGLSHGLLRQWLKRLKRENAVLQEERNILKKPYRSFHGDRTNEI